MEKYTKEVLQEAVSNSNSFADMARLFGIAPHGGAQHHLKRKVIQFDIDHSHFKSKAWSKGRVFQNRRKKPEETLIVLPAGSNRAHSYQLRRALIDLGIVEKCTVCGLGDHWKNKPLTLEVDHIDGDYLNNRIENLRFICPNCHTQTSNYKSRNKRNGG